MGDYIEIQIHGGVHWDDVEKVRIDARSLLSEMVMDSGTRVNFTSLSTQRRNEIFLQIQDNVEKFQLENPDLNIELHNFRENFWE